MYRYLENILDENEMENYHIQKKLQSHSLLLWIQFSGSFVSPSTLASVFADNLTMEEKARLCKAAGVKLMFSQRQESTKESTELLNWEQSCSTVLGRRLNRQLNILSSAFILTSILLICVILHPERSLSNWFALNIDC